MAEQKPEPSRSRFQIDKSQREADLGHVEEVLATPEDDLDRADQLALQSHEEGLISEADERVVESDLDHAGLEEELPEEQAPPAAPEEPTKPRPAKWSGPSP